MIVVFSFTYSYLAMLTFISHQKCTSGLTLSPLVVHGLYTCENVDNYGWPLSIMVICIPGELQSLSSRACRRCLSLFVLVKCQQGSIDHDHVNANFNINTSRNHILLNFTIIKRNLSLKLCWDIEDVNQHSSTLRYMYVNIDKCLLSLPQIPMQGKIIKMY